MGAPEGGMGGEDVDAMAAALDEAGVTPEELQQAMEDVQALQEAGIPPEELANALTEVVGEGGGEEMAGEEGIAAEAAAEGEPVEEEAAEQEVGEKEASVNWNAKVREILNR
jgi:hypothetical protein